MAHVSYKLSNSFEGALAGGGDPATSPLYVFGPFLRLIIIAGVGSVTFGASIWLAILTVVMVSAMYRLVMNWVVDGSGGSGLSEEEFGGWAVKVNAGITFVEYTLTFLVSVAALVTFIADRVPLLNQELFGFQYRTFVAVGLSIITGILVNRGPKMAARAFGPATAAVLMLLWAMIIATIWRHGFSLPGLDFRAFTGEYIGYTFGGYARILALMTGIEIFANLVAAYEGKPREKSRKAFGSLVIIMGTTSITMLIVGPAILKLSDPANTSVSVFTQTMDQLLPGPLAYVGTLVGIAVLLSAAAASAQGLQNLALGLRYRHYIPAFMGQRNKYDVADNPVWIEVGLVVLCFLAFGTHEETYLAIYAAGVFILLSMTGWAATRRLVGELRQAFSTGRLAALAGTLLASLLTTGATILIFEERFLEGAWTFLLFIPALYGIFGYYRKRLGEPTPVGDHLGKLLAGRYLLPFQREEGFEEVQLERVLIPLDGSSFSEQALPIARAFGHVCHSRIALFSVEKAGPAPESGSGEAADLADPRSAYLESVAAELREDGLSVEFGTGSGSLPEAIDRRAVELRSDLIIMCTEGRSGLERWLLGSASAALIRLTRTPVLLLRPTSVWRSRRSRFKRILVTLDGSEHAEPVLPYARAMATRFGAEFVLLCVPEGVQTEEHVARLEQYLQSVAGALRGQGFNARAVVTGSGPARTILETSNTEDVDLIMMATHGLGGPERREHVKVGSVAAMVVQQTERPVFLVPCAQAGSANRYRARAKTGE